MKYARLLQFFYLAVAVLGWLTRLSESFRLCFSLSLTFGIFLSLLIGMFTYFDKGWRWGVSAGLVLPASFLALRIWLGSIEGFYSCLVLCVPLQIYLSARAAGLPITLPLLASTVFTVCGVDYPYPDIPRIALATAAVSAVGLGIFVATLAPCGNAGSGGDSPDAGEI